LEFSHSLFETDLCFEAQVGLCSVGAGEHVADVVEAVTADDFRVLSTIRTEGNGHVEHGLRVASAHVEGTVAWLGVGQGGS
jgi:hypothetical protein